MKVEVGKRYRFVGDEGFGPVDEVVTVILDKDGDTAFYTAHDRLWGSTGPWCVEEDGQVPWAGVLKELDT